MSSKNHGASKRPSPSAGGWAAVLAVSICWCGGVAFAATSTDASGNSLTGVVGWPIVSTASNPAGNRLEGILPGPFAVDSSDIAGNRLFTGALLPDLEGQGTEPTETPTPTNTPGEGETPTPTPTGGRDFDLWPVEVGDGLIDSRDLLELLKIDPRETNDLFEFTEYWKTP